MKYLYNDELVSTLAAEYVLGTLRGKARMRFDRLKAQHTHIQHAVWFWETELNQMVNNIEPVEPSPKVWHAISAQLNFKNNTNVRDLPSAESGSIKPSTRKWQWFSGFAMAACLLMAVSLFNLEYAPETQITGVAVFTNAEAEVLWSVDVRGSELVVKTTQKLSQAPNNDYQLWIVPSSGAAPLPVGLLPQNGELVLNSNLMLDVANIKALAVSIEPLGGSPTGQPTEVLFATELVPIRS